MAISTARLHVGILVFLMLSLSSCSTKRHHTVETAFYYWRTTFDPTTSEMEYLRELGARKLYIKLFEVDWDFALGRAIPQASAEIKQDSLPGFEIIPTIFITNRTLTNIAENDLDQLAAHIAGEIRTQSALFKGVTIREIQLNCDWTEKTRSKYFSLIQALRACPGTEHMKISTTIRLHQVKYRELTGVPPVDKGVLMFYNMGSLEDSKSENSIFDLKVAKSYLKRIDGYPLPLDVALPLYSWGVVLRRGKAVGLLNNVAKDQFEDSTRFVIQPDHVEVMKSTYFDYFYLYRGDKIRLEHVSGDQLRQAVDLLTTELSAPSISVIFFHLDPHIIKDYSSEELKNLCMAFH